VSSYNASTLDAKTHQKTKFSQKMELAKHDRNRECAGLFYALPARDRAEQLQVM
jgi:hypothetical protein